MISLRFPPANYWNSILISYYFYNHRFGQLLIGSSCDGICYLGFNDNGHTALSDLKRRFPFAKFSEEKSELHNTAIQVINNNAIELNLILKGTKFQQETWKALLSVPYGTTTSYGSVALLLNNPNASRAVGTAIGSNPISIIIPCHRVIQASGKPGGYMWGVKRKLEIIDWEARNVVNLQNENKY